MVDGKRLSECFEVSSFCLRKHVTANAQVKGNGGGDKGWE